jgi:CHAT domain-containing protein
MNNEAQESIYKAEASAYRIVHLAMHTLVNDTYPMNSALIFSGEDDKKDDGFLHTYEVYGIPLRATMVVLSSCNTGSGKLSTGEGILSLARGFLYSGSRSVVMSLWKVEDHSGTEIVKMFYGNLKNGMPKSKALKKARYDYLRNASQLRSHPYFWSTLVIFGENSPVFFPWKKVIICSAVLMLITALIIYLQLRNRRYS